MWVAPRPWSWQWRELRYSGLAGSRPCTPTDNDNDGVLAPAKLFSPYTGWRWYITEWDPETRLCFGLVEGFETELGYFDLTDLASRYPVAYNRVMARDSTDRGLRSLVQEASGQGGEGADRQPHPAAVPG